MAGLHVGLAVSEILSLNEEGFAGYSIPDAKPGDVISLRDEIVKAEIVGKSGLEDFTKIEILPGGLAIGSNRDDSICILREHSADMAFTYTLEHTLLDVKGQFEATFQVSNNGPFEDEAEFVLTLFKNGQQPEFFDVEIPSGFSFSTAGFPVDVRGSLGTVAPGASPVELTFRFKTRDDFSLFARVDAVNLPDNHRDTEFDPVVDNDGLLVDFNISELKPDTITVRDRDVHGDRFTVPQDPPKNSAEADMLIATGYLRLGQWDSTASIFQEGPRLHAEMMADLTNTTASAFLGLTMSCRQCHDHKYDPLSQADHFRFRAFFAGVIARDDLPISVANEQAGIEKHNAEVDEQVAPLKAEQKKLDKANKTRHAELTKQIAELEAKKRQPRRAMGATDSGSTAPVTHVFYQGDFSSPREEVAPGFVSVFTPGPAMIKPPRANTTGRRLALAKWITSVENPWTARVIVNRIWQQHFGMGLVATPNDFGYSGGRPTHPELLDWLAIEFMHRGWSIKELHRLIVTSATYRQSSRETPGKRAIDSENQLLWRQNIRRLDAETLRDSLLSASGLLKPYDTGKPIWPPVPDELLKAQPAILEAIEGKDGGGMQGWYADPIEQTDVRSVFLVRKRCLPIPFLQAFDLPDTTVSCARRDTTVVAPQALMLLNSPEGIRYARALAARVLKSQPVTALSNAAQTRKLIDTIFMQAIQRTVTPIELKLSADFLHRHLAQHATKQPADQALKSAVTDLCRAVLNLNEFAYLD